METGPRYRSEQEEFELQQYIDQLADSSNALSDQVMELKVKIKDLESDLTMERYLRDLDGIAHDHDVHDLKTEITKWQSVVSDMDKNRANIIAGLRDRLNDALTEARMLKLTRTKLSQQVDYLDLELKDCNEKAR